ncbi:MAG TPA: phosphate transport system regulatory protein PhoU [Phycisphaerales bacterium]|nr:phosphate transport system regulatory protein PhoU [Phycisphaerales bacterium]
MTAFRHQHHDFRPHLGGDRDHLVGRGHLEIELDLHEFVQSPDVVVLNVASILPEVDRDSRGTTQMRLDRGPGRVGLPGPSGLTDGRDMVDVHAEFDHARMLPAGSGHGADGGVYSVNEDPSLSDASNAFQIRLEDLRMEISRQGVRVLEQATKAVDCYFDHDRTKAEEVVEIEAMVDTVDIEIEKQCIPLLALGQRDPHSIRSVLTIVKVNNEFERIGDCAVTIAEATLDPRRKTSNLPDTYRVMANSVLGMIRDANRALSKSDPVLARRVLDFDDTVDRFKVEILRDAQARVSDGTLAVDGAFRILAVTKSLERIADHCTNVCEQVIYLETGKIVRHESEGWTEPEEPRAPDA